MNKQIVIILSLVHLLLTQTTINNISYIYSPQFLNAQNLNNEKWTPLLIDIDKTNNLVFVSTGFSGISILDKHGSKILFSKSIDDYFIQHIQISNNAQHLFVGFQTHLRVYKLDFQINNSNELDMKSFVQLQEIEFQTGILKILYQEQQELLIVSGKFGIINAYDTSNKSQIYQIGTFTVDNPLINGLFLTKDAQWLYVSADTLGIVIFRLQDNYYQNNSKGQRQLQFIVAGEGIFGTQANFCQTTSDYYVFCFDFWYGFFISNSQQVIEAQQEQYPVQITFQGYWPFSQIVPTIQSLMVNQQETLLLIGVRSQGIYIFDITKRPQISLLQQIKADSLAYSIKLSQDEKYLYLSNSQSVLTYQQVEISLNNNFPNLFNIHQAKFDQLDQITHKSRCYIDSTNSYFIGAFDSDGIFVFPFYKNPYKLNISNYQSYPIASDSIYFESSNKYMIVPQKISNFPLEIYQYNPINSNQDQSNISLMNIKLVKKYNSNTIKVSEMITFSYDKTFAVQTHQTGLILYNSTDILNMSIYHLWENPDFIQGENQGACITKDNKWVLSTVRQFGVYLLNVEDKANPILSDYSLDFGGESILISQTFNYAYLIDGVKGFAIVDISSFPKISILSKIALEGYAIMSLPLQNEDYILVTQQEQGVLLTLIDIRDKHYPYIINKIMYGSQICQAICMPQTQGFIFLTLSQGILTIPMQSEIQIHTDANLITLNQSSGIPINERLNKSDLSLQIGSPQILNEYILQVGQKVQFSFSILYPVSKDISIENIYFYKDGQMVNLPSFFQFDLFSQSLQFTVQNQLLGNNQNQLNLIIILLWTIIPLDQTSFQYFSEDSNDFAVTTLDQSALIYQYLQNQNILDSNNKVNPSYDFSKDLQLNSQFKSQLVNSQLVSYNMYQIITQQLQQKINLTLKKSCYLNPIKFYVVPSLKFDNEKISQFISTNQIQLVSVTLQINIKDGKFVQLIQSSVVTFISPQQDQLKIQGSLENVNNVLYKKVIFSNNTQITENNSPNITITITDNTNYPLVQTFKISKSNFIKLKKQLQINQENNLQKQLENQYPNSVLYIASDVYISFSSNSFFVEDISQLSYKYLYETKNGIYEQIPPDFWLQQQDEQLNLKGSTTAKMYRNTYKFKIIASDGYTQAEDYFQVTVSGISYLYITNLLIQILGPLVAILGLYKYRGILYNIILKNKITYSDETAICGQLFHKEIVILGRTQETARIILNKLFKNILNQQKFKENIKEKYIPEQYFFEDIYKKSSHSQEQIDLLEEQQKQQGSQDQIIKGESIQKKIQITSQILQKLKKHNPKSILEQRYLDQQGQLRFSKVIEDILQNVIYLQEEYFNSYQEFKSEITDQNSRIHKAIRSLISRDLLNLDKKTKKLYEFIKYYCIQSNQINRNDWYKVVVDINYESKDNYLNQSQIFPRLKLKCETLYLVFQMLNLLPKQISQNPPKIFFKFSELVTEQNSNFNLYLLREVLFADVLGFKQKNPSLFSPSVGQSIHLNICDISQVIAFKKRKINKWLQPVFRVLNIEYTKFGAFKNMRLPAWMYLNQMNGKIYLHGVPEQYDSQEIQIRIYDNTGYVIRQFNLKILNNYELKNNNLKSQIDNIYSVADERGELFSIAQNKLKGNQEQIYFADQQVKHDENFRDNYSINSLRQQKRLPQSKFMVSYLKSQNLVSPKDFISHDYLNHINKYEFKSNSNSKNTNENNENSRSIFSEYNQSITSEEYQNYNSQETNQLCIDEIKE
ncbi:hypothetical protein TTHERM_000573208 (macronuclear) [Tetrahymena thermophila SB210]|uniref:Calpain family cysteine protease n=1 Tax=Tetrahymena thermophila (strain SB210) TaxID=312017 RepID=W7XFV2_TETTS|nr:hypothetical protein TTHERM_000573208 [Tetrahymena thermophila SB210]EWS75753.1 hypothetical protein TTHERM_000573208 [Tetrahymena thermophila SB210]|eukprot:XP_012651675.1 hypothetical protein TTHERM_000573208 [Tetrahymena thermophila SB210]